MSGAILNEIAIPAKNLFVPGELGNVHVKYKDHDFFVIDEKNHEFAVERGDLSKELRGISQEQLSKCLRVDCLALSKIGEDYSIRLQHSLKGGGWLSGFFGKTATYTASYVGMAMGGVTATLMVGPVVGVGASVALGAGIGAGIGVTLAAYEHTISSTANKVDRYLSGIAWLP